MRVRDLTRVALLLSCVVAFTVPAPVEAVQTPRSLVETTVDGPTRSLIMEGDRLNEALAPREALERYREALERDPESYAALWRMTRQGVVLGMLAGADEEQSDWYRRAEAWGRQAVSIDSLGREGMHWLAAALGQRALEQGPRARLALAREVRTQAERLVEVDSLHAGGHHILGTWHAEVQRIGGVTRFLARRVLGAGDLGDSSWEHAERHLRTAVRLAPEGLIHHLELGKALRDLGRTDEARDALRQVLERPALTPTDPLHKQEAQRVLLTLPS